MGTYYKHKKTESIKVPYSFQCEQCMKNSGSLMATISGMEAELNSNFKELDGEKVEKLNTMAHTNLVRAVKEAHRNATEKQIYSLAFQDECPHCHKPQSWAVSGMKNEMFSTPIVCVILGIILGVGCYFFSGVENSLTIALIAAGICFLVGIGSLILNIAKVSSKKRQTAVCNQKNKPVIEWSAVQNILDEG
ncbi:MAG: hypothetical protein HFI33_07525 [Lachnospiraceae bacterium]|nr:hypothetical protein [Lachnospiraceae bacterium]